MQALLGWVLAALAVAAGWLYYGWRGLVLALTVVVFWLLLQFSRTLRVLRNAARSPVGHVASAVMFNARLAPGLRLPEAIKLAGSLGRAVREEPPLETFGWADAGGDRVEVDFVDGRVTAWRLLRAQNDESPAAAGLSSREEPGPLRTDGGDAP